mgnify:CR=1 FL=1
MNITITGHRKINHSAVQIINFKMKELVENPEIETIYFGGAKGTDTEALLCALSWRDELKRKNLRLIAVVPDTLKNQPKETHEISKMADEIIELKNTIMKENKFESFKIRNHYMVDRSDKVVAFWNGQYKSGTYSAMNYARKNKKYVEEIRVD